jgi:hypothetical protein
MMLVVVAFFLSVTFGVIVAVVVAGAVVARFGELRSFVENPPVVLVIADSGLGIKRGWVPEIEIPWQDIEVTDVSRGRRGSTILLISVENPRKYLGEFTRMNRALSRYHISIPVSGLELPAKEVVSKIEDAWKACA